MQLLVSVANATDASAAMAGGADVIDAKDPQSGALGAVRPDTLSVIRGVVDGRRPLTAALGDAATATGIEAIAGEFAKRGASLVKVGFAGIVGKRHIESLIAAAVAGCASRRDGHTATGVVAVAYADGDAGCGIDCHALVGIAARAGARGVLLDTADKHAPGLTSLRTLAELSSWVADVHAHGLIAALAGKLTADDLTVVRDAGADIAGVRGAACDGGRAGSVSADRVRMLRERLTA
jgi:uncharacterized protein (UPF0264 family)